MDIPSLLSDSIGEEEKIVSRVLVASGTHMITTTERVFIHREEGIINSEIFEGDIITKLVCYVNRYSSFI